MEWKQLKSKTIFTHKRLTLVEDDVELPSGIRTKYLKFKEGFAGAEAICINNEGLILLQEQYVYPSNKMMYQFPGGAIDSGESIQDGMNRELMEEADLKSNSLKQIGYYIMNHRRSVMKRYVYVATDLVYAHLEQEYHEFITSKWVELEYIDEIIGEGKVHNSSFLSSWAIYKAYLLKNVGK